MDFIAELTQHIPDPRTHLVRYFGWYSNKSRGLRARPTPTGRAMNGLRRRGPHRPVQPDADGPP